LLGIQLIKNYNYIVRLKWFEIHGYSLLSFL